MSAMADEINTLLQKKGIPEAHRISQLAADSLRIEVGKPLESNHLAGVSRFAGGPDVPASFDWPKRDDGRVLSFLAQIDLSRLPPSDLPKSGWLLFFYDIWDQKWGFDPTDADCFKVVYFEASRSDLMHVVPGVTELNGKIVATHPDTQESSSLEPQRSTVSREISFRMSADIPEFEDSILPADLKNILTQDPHFDSYLEVEDTLVGQLDNHHLLGLPQLIQTCVREQCHLVSNGVYAGGSEYPEDERTLTLRSQQQDISEWRLLLQLDESSKFMGWEWGLSGMIYFWIKESDLLKKDFSKVWLVLQCY